jgi:hypothetical protein
MIQISARMQKTYVIILNFICSDTTGTPHPSSWILATLSCSLTVQEVARHAVVEASRTVSVHMQVALVRVHEDCDIAVPKHCNYMVLVHFLLHSPLD